MNYELRITNAKHSIYMNGQGNKGIRWSGTAFTFRFSWLTQWPRPSGYLSFQIQIIQFFTHLVIDFLQKLTADWPGKASQPF